MVASTVAAPFPQQADSAVAAAPKDGGADLTRTGKHFHGGLYPGFGGLYGNGIG